MVPPGHPAMSPLVQAGALIANSIKKKRKEKEKVEKLE
jgi:glutaminase